LGELDLLAPELGELEVLHLEVRGGGGTAGALAGLLLLGCVGRGHGWLSRVNLIGNWVIGGDGNAGAAARRARGTSGTRPARRPDQARGRGRPPARSAARRSRRARARR